jgi:hypothetical protein
VLMPAVLDAATSAEKRNPSHADEGQGRRLRDGFNELPHDRYRPLRYEAGVTGRLRNGICVTRRQRDGSEQVPCVVGAADERRPGIGVGAGAAIVQIDVGEDNRRSVLRQREVGAKRAHVGRLRCGEVDTICSGHTAGESRRHISASVPGVKEYT